MAALLAAVCGLAGCGPDEVKLQRAQAEQAAREERAAAEARAELEADQARFKKISASLVDPNAKPAEESDRPAPSVAAAEPTPAPIPVTAAASEQNLGASDRTKKLRSSVAVLEGLASEGLECSNTLKTYPQPDQQQLTRCLKFTERTAPDTEWSRALSNVSTLSTDDQFFRANQSAFVKAQKLIDEVNGYNDYAWSRLRTITGRTKPA